MASIIQITPHEVFPPRGGRRAFFYLREMSREHQVSVIVPQKLDSFLGVRDDYGFPKNVEVLSSIDSPPPRTPLDLLGPKIGGSLHYRWLRRSWKGPAYSTLLRSWHLIRSALSEKRIDLVVFDHIETMSSCAWYVRRLAPDVVLALNAHNVDSELYKAQVEKAVGPEQADRLRKSYEGALTLETHLADYVDVFWACSGIDCSRLEELNGGSIKGYAVPNGIAIELLPFDESPAKQSQNRILFCGALNYAPNRSGLEWFYEKIWPLILARSPATKLRIIGYGAGPGDFGPLRRDPAVEFIGEVTTVAPHYYQTSLSVVPLMEGSGTRVKILEAMSLGSPVVSTRIGAEGIAAVDGKHLLLADEPESFADSVVRLLSERDFHETLRQNARSLVAERYDWRTIGKDLNSTIGEILGSKRAL